MQDPRAVHEHGDTGFALYKFSKVFVSRLVSRCGLAVRRLAGKQKDLGSIRFGLSCDFAHTINETSKWLTQLPTLMQNYSGGDSVTSRC